MVDWLTDFLSFFKDAILLTLRTPSLLIMLIGLFLTGLLIDRWWLLLFPVALQTLSILGVSIGWWGYGLSEDWQYGSISSALIGVSAVALGLVVRRVLNQVRRRPRQPPGQPRTTEGATTKG